MQRDVADRAGISVQYVSEIERGRKEVTRAVGRRLIRSSG
jgi:transcriptional regulator with XRE-family HTH domain